MHKGVWPVWLALSGAIVLAAPSPQAPESPRSFETLLQAMAASPADPCRSRPGARDFGDFEYELFGQADKAVTDALNAGTARVPKAAARAGEAVAALEKIGAAINKDWPDENRFHARVIDIAPAVLVAMTYRNRAMFSFFAVPERDDDNKPTTKWEVVTDLDDGRFKPRAGYDSLDLFPIARGPSGRLRFLAKFVAAGCGSGVGVSYVAYEWNPTFPATLAQVIRTEGAVTQEQPADHDLSNADLSAFFPPAGELKTDGSIISLPYCWFSAIDTWDNPSLCAVDSYDVSGNRVRFAREVVNRPDLLPVVQAIDHAQAHDYPAVLAYCASADVARRIMSDIPSLVAADHLKVTRIASGRERVEFGDVDTVVRFDVQKRGDRWVVTAFQIR